MDTTKLVAARDALNTDVGKLVAASTVSQLSIDTITTQISNVDGDVIRAIGVATPLNFKAFNLAVIAFLADTKLTQAAIDVATGAVQAATI